MTEAELEAVLQTAFRQCEMAGYVLDEEQKQILTQSVKAQLCGQSAASNENPLDRLTSEQRDALFQFIRAQERREYSWKVTLLNDWLQNRDSGSVQFIRDLYGVQWLESLTTADLAKYEDETALKLKVGDRIEVSNGLWEWVQETGPCSREWVLCTVVSIREGSSFDNLVRESCTVRFDNGSEYEIRGVYDWNRANWRWTKR